MIDPEVGDFVGWIVGWPGPDIDHALCIGRKEGKAKIRYQVYREGPWHEDWEPVRSAREHGCWKTERPVYDGLKIEKQRLFPDA